MKRRTILPYSPELKELANGDESTACTSDADCVGIGNGLCGHAGHRDWCIPNAKRLQSIADYGQSSPAIDPSFPGDTAASGYWSATTFAFNAGNAWFVFFGDGSVNFGGKTFDTHARAVRPCP